MNKYHKEPVLLKVLSEYPDTFNPKEVVEYFENKISLRNGKPLADKSKVSQISTFKRVLKDIKNIPELAQLKMPDSIALPVREHQAKQLIQQNAGSLVVENSEALIKKILLGLKSERFYELYPALLLACGRRPAEIYQMRFRKVPNFPQITFKNQLKKRGELVKYNITLLCDIKVFRKALKKFQSFFPGVFELTPQELHSKYSNNNVKTLLFFSEENGIKLKASDFRRIYVAKSYQNALEMGDTRSFNLFIQDHLGHANLGISLNYANVILK